MKKAPRILLAAGCAAALIAGSAAASSAVTTRTLLAQYLDISLKVDGQTVLPRDANGNPVEPFSVDGTTYLPVRALAEALGKKVAWDPDARTISIGSTPLAEDARQLVSMIETVHPAFALGQVPEDYAAAKAAFLETAQAPDCSLSRFTLAAMAYTASLADAHTRVDPFGGVPQPMLDIAWSASGDHLYLLEEGSRASGGEVTEIGGLKTADLFAQLDRCLPTENTSGQNWNHAVWARYGSILALFGASLAPDGASVALTVQENGVSSSRTAYFTAPTGADHTPIASTEYLGDIFYVDLNQCIAGDEVTAAAQALSQAVQSGVRQVIVDVRGNRGGDSRCCEQLLTAMGMSAPTYGACVRYSFPAQVQRGYAKDSGLEQFDPNLAAAKVNPDLQLAVLTDEQTFSSATMLGVFVQDGNLGTVIGRPSANAPNSYGDILSVVLGNTSLSVYISHKQWSRPDAAANPKELTPDLLTEAGEDILQTALEFFGAPQE